MHISGPSTIKFRSEIVEGHCFILGRSRVIFSRVFWVGTLLEDPYTCAGCIEAAPEHKRASYNVSQHVQ